MKRERQRERENDLLIIESFIFLCIIFSTGIYVRKRNEKFIPRPSLLGLCPGPTGSVGADQSSNRPRPSSWPGKPCLMDVHIKQVIHHVRLI